MLRYTLLISLFAILSTSATASAQGAPGMVTSGAASLEITSFSATNGYSSDLESADGTDHRFAFGIWYRIGTTGGETALGTPTTADYTADVATLTYTDVDSTGLDIVVTITVSEPSAGQAAFAVSVSTTNTTSASVDLELFGYVDAEADGGSLGDSATLTSALPTPSILVTDSGATVSFSGTAVDSFQVIDYSNLRTLLNDATPTTLDGTGLPFVDDDWTGAYGWSQTLTAGASFVADFAVEAAESTTTDGGVADAGTDAATDAGTDAATDAGTDAATDGGTTTDSGTTTDGGTT
ncbi:MAG: hypothetical protein DRJ42_24295, partial [Deltaproteobacteria bacterium]